MMAADGITQDRAEAPGAGHHGTDLRMLDTVFFKLNFREAAGLVVRPLADDLRHHGKLPLEQRNTDVEFIGEFVGIRIVTEFLHQ